MPKALSERLCNSMQLTQTSWQTWEQWPGLATLELGNESLGNRSMLKLNLETWKQGDVIVVSCRGRIVYRDEAAALSRLVGQMLRSEATDDASGIVLDLSGVSGMDGAGLGQLALLQTWAMKGRTGKGVSLKFASPNPVVRHLLSLTNLDRALELHPSVDAAVESFREQQLFTSASC